MSEEWVQTTLGEVADYINGYPFKPSDLRGSCLPVIRIKQLLDPSAETDYTDLEVPEKVHLSDGDLVFSWSGSLASRLWNRGPAVLNQHLFRVVEKQGVLREWLHLALDAAVTDLAKKTHGTTMKHVTKGVLESHSIVLPPLRVQRRIVDLMAHLDNHLESLRVELGTSKRLVRVLRQEAFRSLGSEGSRPAGEVFDMLLGRQKSERQSVGEHVIPYMRAANISEDGLKIDDVQCMNFSPSEQAKYCLRPGDILLVEGGTVGLCAQWEGQVSGAVGFDKHVIRVRPRAELSTASYALHWAKWCRESGAFDAQATGITIKALGFGRASSMPVPVLGLAEQSSLVAPLDVCESTIRNLTAEVEATRTLRGALLSELLAGATELPVSYDSLLPEVA